MQVDKEFCMSSYLMYRYIYDNDKCFFKDLPCKQANINFKRFAVRNSQSLLHVLENITKEACLDNKAALTLSGGMDSAILARLVPEGTKAYTFRCIVPGKKVTDETKTASKWARMNKLDHVIIDISWEDLICAAVKCMYNKNAPIHSIEAQVYIAAKKALKDGKTKLIFGENADIIYGGMDGLLAKDWLYSEFIERYTYIMPYKVLKNPVLPITPYRMFEINGHIDGYDFTNTYFRQEALGTYTNACEAAGISFVGPYAMTYMDVPINYSRIRSGDTKYIIQELFMELYPGEILPEKIPMPRPVDKWLSGWKGPVRFEFIPHCTDNMSGDQKWMVWCLEHYLNMIGEKN